MSGSLNFEVWKLRRQHTREVDAGAESIWQWLKCYLACVATEAWFSIELLVAQWFQRN